MYQTSSGNPERREGLIGIVAATTVPRNCLSAHLVQRSGQVIKAVGVGVPLRGLYVRVARESHQRERANPAPDRLGGAGMAQATRRGGEHP